MKNFVLACLVVLVCYSLSVASGGTAYTSTVATSFQNYSATSATQVISAPIAANACRYKNAYVQGVAVAGHANSALSGTLAVLCSATGVTGSFVPCLGLTTTAAGAAVATTTNGMLTWQDAAQYTAFGWSKTAGEVSVYFSCGN